ncbi:MAG: outer rane immunogenic protein [Alphaproteobacteria bacterium]|nr:outer rane immunogenic protein [Alphaproteobacteria bacterium]
MRQAFISGVALAVLIGGTAGAADLNVAPMYKAPAPAPATFSWSGLYIGTHTGVAVGHTTTNNVAPFGGFDEGVPVRYELDPVNIFGGGQIGYNWQMANWVFGAEVDVGYLGNRQSSDFDADNRVAVKYGWYSTFTGRLGLAYDRLFSYVKGGAAVTRIRNTATDLDFALIDPLDFSQINHTRWGWALGTGFEYAILPSWTVKSEYLYMDFGTERSTNRDGDFFDHKTSIHTWKVGLNYKWGGGSLLPGL